jgi:hypothetical protein
MNQTLEIKSDYQVTGKLYPKLDAYAVYHHPDRLFYLGSSCQFKTQKNYKKWLRCQPQFAELVLCIEKSVN